jgi:hypothetical protein
MASEDFEYAVGDDEDAGSEPFPSKGLSGPELERSIKNGRNAGKNTLDHPLRDTEEAVAQQRLRSGDPYAYRSGFGKTGAKRAEMLKFEQMAKANKTTVPAALRDYSGIEDAARRHPLLGVEALAQRMGWNSRELAAAYAQAHHGSDGGQQLGGMAASHNNTAAAQNALDEASAHPANKHLNDPRLRPGTEKWMADYLSLPMQNGRPYGVHLAENVPDVMQRLGIIYREYDKAFRAHMATT